MTPKRGLGKGLDALIPGETQPFRQTGGVLQVMLDDIRPNPRQPRTEFDTRELEELAQSIAKHGVLQPILVAPDEGGQGYQLIIGERRWQAARIAGLDSVPVIVRQVDEQQQLVLALIENLQRSDLNPLEAADGYRQLADDFSLSHEEIASFVGKSRAAISNTLRLLNLPDPVRQALREGKISEGHARALLALRKPQAQSAALAAILKQGLNVRQAEELVRRLSGETRKKSNEAPKAPEFSHLEELLREALGTRVTLQRSRRGGSIIIHFYSDEELNAILDQLLQDSKKT